MSDEYFSYADRLAAKHGITRDGARWLLLALDPFHDESTPVAGYPDSNGGQSIVLCHQGVASLSGAAAYDFLMWNNPILMSNGLLGSAVDRSNSTLISYESTPPTAVVVAAGQVHQCDTGGEIVPYASAVAAWAPGNFVDYQFGNVTLTNHAVPARMIACGFEVIDTTAEIAKQGSIVVGRQNSGLATKGAYRFADNDAADATANYKTLAWQGPPPAVAFALKQRTSKTWLLKQGAYCTCTLAGIENPVEGVSCNRAYFETTDNSGATGHGICNHLSGAVYMPLCRPAPWNLSFAYGVGTAAAGTYNIVWRCYTEYFPSAMHPLAEQSSPSAGYDLKALQLYSEMVNVIPAGTPVRNNASGDWWRGILRIIEATAPTLGMLVEPVFPGAGMVGQIAGRAAGAATLIRRKKKEKKKTQPKVIARGKTFGRQRK
jgi:hypothetical protein